MDKKISLLGKDFCRFARNRIKDAFGITFLNLVIFIINPRYRPYLRFTTWFIHSSIYHNVVMLYCSLNVIPSILGKPAMKLVERSIHLLSVNYETNPD